MWQLAHVALISAFLCVTSLAPFAPCTEWQLVQATSFLACPLAIRPTGVLWFKWQVRQVSLTAFGANLSGFRISSAEADSACFAPGPWQDSQLFSFQPRRAPVSIAK